MQNLLTYSLFKWIWGNFSSLVMFFTVHAELSLRFLLYIKHIGFPKELLILMDHE